METLQQRDTAWPPVPVSNNRRRGFYTNGVLDSRRSAQAFAEEFEALGRELEELPEDRLSVQLVASQGGLAQLKLPPERLETFIPIAGTELGIVFIGLNLATRQMSREALTQNISQIKTAASGSPQDVSTFTFRNPRTEFSLTKRGRSSIDGGSWLAHRRGQLYREFFGYSGDDVAEVFRHDGNIFADLGIHKQIDSETADLDLASTALAEPLRVTVDGIEPLQIYEITDAATNPRYRGRGLYSAISGFLIRHLVELRNSGEVQVDAIFGESNLAQPGVVMAAHKNGRRFSYFDRQRLGIENPAFGILPQNFSVNDGTETRSYNDFAVSYVPLDMED